MNLKENSLSPLSLTAKVKNFTVHHNSDALADFSIDLTYQSPQQPITWTVLRSFESFEVLHSLLVRKFEKTPFLPCRLILPLNEKERIERALLMENYVNICIKNMEILNSLEFRLFIDLEKHVHVYSNPPTIMFETKMDEFQPIGVRFVAATRVVLVLTSSIQHISGLSVKRLLNGISSFWANTKKVTGRLFLLKEKVSKSLNFEPKASFDFLDDTPTVMEVSETNLNIYVGFASGIVCVYQVEKLAHLVQLTRFECHKQPVRLLHNIDQEGFLLSSSDDRSLMVNELGSGTGFYHEETQFLYPLTTMYYNNKLSVLFLGDSSGRMHVYKQGTEFRGKKFTLILTEKLADFKIISIATDPKEIYIYVGYENGMVEIYETGKGFQSVPVLIKNFKIGSQILKMRFAGRSKSLVLMHGDGQLTFCYYADSNNYFTQLAHAEKLTDFWIAEEERLLVIASNDGYVSVWYYDECLFSLKMPENRGIEKWKNVDVEDFFLPEKRRLKKRPRESNEVAKIPIAEKPVSQIQDIEDEDLTGWDS